MTQAFVPRAWNANGDQTAPAPYIPTVDGLMFEQYKQTLEHTGQDKDGAPTEGRGYGDQVAIITDPRTGAIGAVTQWTWNDVARWYVWTPEGLQVSQPVEYVRWTWDAVDTVRHVLTHYAFTKAHREGRTVGLWAQAPDRATADAAHTKWMAARNRQIGVTA